VRYAYYNGLDLKDEAVTISAGKYGSIEALATMYELDGNWDAALTKGAAARGKNVRSCLPVTISVPPTYFALDDMQRVAHIVQQCSPRRRGCDCTLVWLILFNVLCNYIHISIQEI
jgi:hypothetical protein